MINKNKFSIKDTKKVLHKVGKKWVVVSAVLLGLAAGGAAVTTANADTTAQADQPATAQQVAKNANMSSANHSFGAADPANMTKAPATMKLGAEQGNNGSINIKGHNVPTTTQGIKNDAKHYASYANVYNLSALASEADAHGASAQYSDLVNLASKAPSEFNSYELGSDVSTNSGTNSSATTLFGILNHALSDINAINNGNSNSKLTKISHALSDIQSLALDSSYRSGNPIKLSVPNEPVSVSVGSSVSLGSSVASDVNNSLKNMGLSGVSLSASQAFSVTPFSSTYDTSSAHASMSASVSIDIPSIINNGISESTVDSLVSSLVYAFASNASSNVTPNAKAFAESLASSNKLASHVDNDIYSILSSSNGFLSSAVSDVTAYKDANTAYSTLSGAANESPTVYRDDHKAQGVLNTALISNSTTQPFASKIEQKVESNPGVMNTGTSISIPMIGNKSVPPLIPMLKTSLDKATDKIPSTIRPLLTQFLQPTANINSGVTKAINSLIQSKVSEQALNPIIDRRVENKIQSFLYDPNTGFAPTTIKSLNSKIHSFLKFHYSNMFGPFADKNISNASDYVDDIQGVLGQLPSPFNNPNKISKANNALDAVNNGINDANDIASDVVNTPSMSSEYNAVVNSAANLANDLSNNTSAYNDYNSMYNNASLLASGLTANHNRTANHIMTNIAIPASNIAQTYLTSDKIVFNGDPSSNFTTSKGIKSTTSSVSAPSGYHFSDNNNQEQITFDGKTYTFNVASTASNGGSHGKGGSTTPSTDTGNNDNTPFINPIINTNVAPSSASEYVAPASANSNNISSIASKKHAANYVKVIKNLQLHTNPNFTKRNAKAVLEPGTTFKIEKAVKAHNGALRYEVKYNKKNYYITANKHWVYAYYKANENTHANLKNYVHYRYAKVIKALQLHTNAKFTKRNGVMVVRPGTEFHINRIVKSHGLVRYAVRYRGHNYFITANHDYTVNAYVQKYNYRKHGYKAVRVIAPLNEYRKLNFAKRSFIRHFYRGSVLPVKRVITIGKGEMTRLELTNGRYVTANKDFVEPIR